MKPKLPFNPWPWALITFFTILISAIAAFVTFASTHKMELVSNDYYDREVRFQQHIDQLNRTQGLREPCEIAYTATNATFQVRIPQQHRGQISHGTVTLYRPADSRLDQSFPLITQEDGTQVIQARGLAEGLWRVRVAWTVQGMEYFHETACVLPPAKSAL